MSKIKIVRSNEVQESPFPGNESKDGGWMKRIIYPPHVETKSTFMGIAEVQPGNSPHKWHTHTKDSAPNYEVNYPEKFEEVYHILSGNGVVQWKAEDGSTEEEKVQAGDTIFYPAASPMHQLYNNSHYVEL